MEAKAGHVQAAETLHHTLFPPLRRLNPITPWTSANEIRGKASPDTYYDFMWKLSVMGHRWLRSLVAPHEVHPQAGGPISSLTCDPCHYSLSPPFLLNDIKCTKMVQQYFYVVLDSLCRQSFELWGFFQSYFQLMKSYEEYSCHTFEPFITTCEYSYSCCRLCYSEWSLG